MPTRHPSEVPFPVPDGESTRPGAILFLSIAAGLGGSTRSLSTVLGGMRGRATRVLATPAAGKFPRLVREQGLAEEIISIPKPGARIARRLSRPLAALRIARWARTNRGRLLAIHGNGLQEVNLAVAASLVTGVPLVMWIHDYEVSPWTRRLGPLWGRILRRRPVRWVAVSSLARRLIVEAGLAHAEDVEIVPNPIDPGEFVDERRRTPRGVPVVGFLGSDARRKGLHLVPDVDRYLNDDVPFRWALFTGRGAESDQNVWRRLEALAADRVSFPGKVLNVREAYAACDIVFCPSLQESFCRVAAEAMCNGLPVVATDIEPLHELVGDGEAGLLFPPGDAEAAAVALRRLLIDPALRRTCGERGRERAANFAPARVVDRLAELYGSELGGS